MREIYTSLAMNIVLQAGIVYYPSNDNHFCSCGGKHAEGETFARPVTVV